MSTVHSKEAPPHWPHLSDTWLQLTGSGEQHEECCGALLLRQNTLWEWWEREPLVLGCPNLEQRLCLAELGRGREETTVLVLVSQTLMKFFLPNFNFFALMIFHLLFAFKIISRGIELFGFCCNSFHQIHWGWVSRVGSAVVPEVNLLPFCLSSILIMLLYPPFHT